MGRPLLHTRATSASSPGLIVRNCIAAPAGFAHRHRGALPFGGLAGHHLEFGRDAAALDAGSGDWMHRARALGPRAASRQRADREPDPTAHTHSGAKEIRELHPLSHTPSASARQRKFGRARGGGDASHRSCPGWKASSASRRRRGGRAAWRAVLGRGMGGQGNGSVKTVLSGVGGEFREPPTAWRAAATRAVLGRGMGGRGMVR